MSTTDSNADRERNERGRFVEELTEQDILKVFDEEPEPFLTTAQIAKQFPKSERTVRRYLTRMEDDGLLESKSPAKAKLWSATVAPELDDETAERVDDAKQSDFIAIDEA